MRTADPDANHVDNANMYTPPDGTSPTMQMYLWHSPGKSDEQEPWVPASGANDASILYHEYTHGLSNRLVVDATGNSTLNSIQAGSMGEAWSDFYAMDYLVSHGLEKDTTAAGEVLEGKYVAARRPVPHPGDRLPREGGQPELCQGSTVPRAATPTATSRPSAPARRRCTRPVRSGPRPCGTCVSASVAATR